MRFLHVLAYHPWRERPLLVDPDGNLSEHDRAAATSAYEKVGVPALSLWIHFGCICKLAICVWCSWDFALLQAPSVVKAAKFLCAGTARRKGASNGARHPKGSCI